MAMRGDRLDEFELGPMSPENSAFGGTAFTVSMDLKSSTLRDFAPPDTSSRCAAALAALGSRTSRDNRLGRGSGNAPKTEDDRARPECA